MEDFKGNRNIIAFALQKNNFNSKVEDGLERCKGKEMDGKDNSNKRYDVMKRRVESKEIYT